MIKILAIEGQRLDEIVVDYYGSTERFEEALELNPHLLDTMHLRAGDEVFLNQLEAVVKVVKSEKNLKALW